MLYRAQLLLIAILCATSLRKFVGAEKGEQGRRESHKEKDFLQQRTKRYAIGRVPLSYVSLTRPSQHNKVVDDDSDGYRIDKRFSSIRSDPGSHFRELQKRKTRRPLISSDEGISPGQLQAYRNLLQYYGNGRDEENIDVDTTGYGDIAAGSDVGPLSDEELQALLRLIDEYKLQGKSVLPPPSNFYIPPAQYFTPDMVGSMGKRETGKRSRSQLGLEQPMSFENSASDNYPVFLSSKRSKRIGDPKSSPSVRIKKETDPAVEASLDKIFGGTAQQVIDDQHSTQIPTTAISSSDQIPAPSGSQRKPKKAIDWSDYFGIDKRQDKKLTEAKQTLISSSTDTVNHHHDEVDKRSDSEKSDKTIAPVSPYEGSTAKAPEHSEKPDKEKKDSSRSENDTEEKADDRKWILKEFYKNLAMATNVKRKRESPNAERTDDLNKLEKIERKMEEAGDKIIWDTLKYTGAHKDAELSPEELAHVKNDIIQKLSAAYSLEKIRGAIEEFRQQLAQLKDKQQYY